jgi:hypothetical protein
MSVSPLVCLSICQYVGLSVSLSVHLSVAMFIPFPEWEDDEHLNTEARQEQTHRIRLESGELHPYSNILDLLD